MLTDIPDECILSVLELVSVRDLLSVGATCRALRQLSKDNGFWLRLAHQKWGPAAEQLKAEGEATAAMSWRDYCLKRFPLHSISPSPLRLIQERFPDPWHHITCCVLCTRTSGGAIIHNTILSFFVAYPTPTAVLDADPNTLKAFITPLGLQPSRFAAVRAIAHDFLAADWRDPSEFHGCGAFVSDSWRVFCRGEKNERAVGDAKLRQYVRWARTGELQAASAKRKCEACADGADEDAKQQRDQQQQRIRKAVACAGVMAAEAARKGSSVRTQRSDGRVHDGAEGGGSGRTLRSGRKT